MNLVNEIAETERSMEAVNAGAERLLNPRNPAAVVAEIYIAMNEEGEFEVGTSEEEAGERLVDTYGGCMSRIVKLPLLMTPPRTMEAPGVDIADDAGTTVAVEDAA
jgi:hypothetical protein